MYHLGDSYPLIIEYVFSYRTVEDYCLLEKREMSYSLLLDVPKKRKTKTLI